MAAAALINTANIQHEYALAKKINRNPIESITKNLMVTMNLWLPFPLKSLHMNYFLYVCFLYISNRI